jgi:HEAT repeat protein
MGFDVQNFGIGLLSGWASAYAVYRFRHVAKAMADSVRDRAQTAQNNATRSADSRYVNELIMRCETSHVAGGFAKLSDLLVEPRFLAAPEMAGADEDDLLNDVFHVVPRIHDLPWLHAPYNIPTVSIADLGNGARHLALLGLPGSGRTTALLTIALFSLNRVRFKPPTDAVQRLIEQEEAKLPEKERAQRVQARMKLEAQARETLAAERGITFANEGEDSKKNVPLFNRLMPVYVDFAHFDFDAFKIGEVDPAEPLVTAVQSSVGRITASTIPGNLYDRLTAGQVLLLLDGFDTLTSVQQTAARSWFEAFLQQYAGNFIIVVGSAEGYGALTQMGLTPVFLRPWQDLDTRRAIEHWGAVFPRFGNRRVSGARKVSEEALATAHQGGRLRSPFEMVLTLWEQFASDSNDPSLEAAYRAYLRRRTPAKMPDDLMKTLAKMAELELNEGVITRQRMEKLGIGGAAPMTTTEEHEALPDALRESFEPSSKRAAKAAQEVAKQAARRVASPQTLLLQALKKSGMIIRYRKDVYRFRHSPQTAFFASLLMAETPAETLYERLQQVRWMPVFRAAATHMPLDTWVNARLGANRDILHTHITETAIWLRYAPAEAPWRGSVLKQLTNLLMLPNQYPAVRERAAAALVSAGDRSILFILRRTARNANPQIRLLACLAMGAMGDPEAIADLRSLVQDANSDVQLAAGMAMGAIATEEALEAMAVAFTQDSEPVRTAMAEAFAALPDEGHPLLYEAMRDDDVLLRRCAIAGIRRINAGWALAAIFRAFIEETEWYVKSAAEVAFLNIQGEMMQTPTQAYPAPAQIGWLREWARQRGQIIAEQDGYEALLTALQDVEPTMRAQAAETLGQLGHFGMIKPLYNALLDGEEPVRAASYRALAELQTRLGKALPLPV